MTAGRFVFIVRIWFEDGQASADGRQVPMVRGSVEHVDRESVHYFASLNEVTAHIEEAIRPSEAETPSSDAPPSHDQ